MENLNPHKQKLESLKKTFETELKTYEGINSDYHLTRFLTARDNNLKKTVEMLKNYFLYRKKYNYTKIKKYNISKFLKEIKNLLKWDFYNYDKDFRPLFIHRAHISNFIKLTKKYPTEIFIKFFIHKMERLKNIILPICSEMKNSQVKGLVLIFDLKNNNPFSFLKKEFKTNFKPLIDIAQNNFPETISKIFIINAPKLFSMFWAVVKMWLTKRTKKKIVLSNSHLREKFLEIVHEELLPTFLGGSCTYELFEGPGPWKREVECSRDRGEFYMRKRDLVKKWYGE